MSLPIDSQCPSPIGSAGHRRRQRLAQPDDRVVDRALRGKSSSPQTRSRISERPTARGAASTSMLQARGSLSPAGTRARRAGRSTAIASQSIVASPTCRPPRRLRRQHMPHAQHELLQVKRLRQVLVGAELEPGQPALGGVQRGHEHDRRASSACGSPARGRSPTRRAASRRRWRGPRGRRAAAARARANVSTHSTSRPSLIEPLRERLAQRAIVFDQQDARHQAASGSSKRHG